MNGGVRASLGGMAALVLALAVLPRPVHAAESFPRGHFVGGSFGTPSVLNLEYSREFGPRAFYLTGGYFSKRSYGVQLAVGLERNGTPRKHGAVNLIAGTFSLELFRSDPETWHYGGFEVYLKYRSLFVAPAFTVGDGSVYTDTVRFDTDPTDRDHNPHVLLLIRLGLVVGPLR